MPPRRQGIFWILTIPHHGFTPYLPVSCQWIKGQLEHADSGFLHWQIIVAVRKKTSLSGITNTFGPYHAELSRSSAAGDYVWKEDTRVAGTQFQLGVQPINRAVANDWEKIWEDAKHGLLEQIPPQIRVSSYRTLRAIGADYARPLGMERSCAVYWGPTGTGKSRTAWEQFGMDAYPKDPRSKFWCGYRSQQMVIIDEFRGGIDIGHILRWLDRYPVNVEIKGSSVPLLATNFCITSNIPPSQWYPDLDPETMAALLRRMTVTQFHAPL
ncbi:replication protein [uncultured marine virus]|nr:replication protein [uncultured marine virus]